MMRWFFLPALLVVAVAPLGAAPPERPLEQVIDQQIDAALKSAGVTPAPSADDAAFLRRATLDLVGRIPTLGELNAYLARTDPAKKLELIERLMSSPAFVRHQTQEFYTLMALDDQRPKKGSTPGALRDYLQTSFAENRPWDRIFRELMLPDEADGKAKGAAEFIKGRVKDLNRLTIDVSSLFFGVNISCAQCHDHPHVPSWTQDHFYGMKSFFARTFENGGFLGEYEAGMVKYIPNKGQEKLAPVMFLTGAKIEAPNLREPTGAEKKQAQERINQAKKGEKAPLPAFSLRAKLVETALAPSEQDFFARSIANRLWYRFFGRGLVMPLDQMHSENPPSHPELLTALARDVAGHGYDLRRLIRGIVLSSAYARDSRYSGDDAPDEKLFAVAQVRPLTPAQLALSLRIAAASPQSLPEDRAELEKRIEALDKASDKLAKNFPIPGDNFQVGASEALLFNNNEEMQKELLDGPTSLVVRLQALSDPRERADLAVRVVLGRAPRSEEVQALADYLSRRQDRPAAACQQIVWALLTSAEFRFNH
jgi:hypothetical protein